MAKKEKTYAEAMLELESILAKIEAGDLDIDLLAEEIKRASVLIKFCKDKLFKTEDQIKKIINEIE